MKSFLNSSLVLLLLLVSAVSLRAQLVVNTASPYSQYVTGLSAPGISITNVNLSGCDTAVVSTPNFSQMGGFNATGITNFNGLTTGVLLTSGSAPEAVFSPTKPAQSLPSPPPTGSPLLDALIAPDITNDACVVTFDIVATCDTVFFKYVFASEEYDTPSNTATYHDLCGMFISGGSYAPNTNLALIPGVGSIVSVANINPTTNPAYLVTSAAGPQVSYDGYTTGLVAKAAVVPGQTYSMTFAVADEQDGGNDAALFVEKGSCSFTPPPPAQKPKLIVRTPEGAVEGCRDARVVIIRGTDPDTLDFDMVYTPSPISGASLLNDYNTTHLGPTITMLPGEDSIVITISPVNDGITEATESFTINAQFGTDTLIGVVRILDAITVFAGPDTTVCPGNPVVLGSPAKSFHTYQWTTSFNPNGLSSATVAQPTVVLNPTFTANVPYTVVATDSSGCTATDVVIITVPVAPDFTFTMPDSLCVGEVGYASTTTTSLTYQYTWNFGPFSMASNVVTSSTNVYWTEPGTYAVSLQISIDGCASSESKQVKVNPIPSLSITNSGDACPTNQVQLNYGMTPIPNLTYAWDFDGGTSGSTTVPNPIVTWATAGTKIVSLQVAALGCISPVVYDTIIIHALPVADFTLPQTICAGEAAQITYTGTTAGVTYNWTFGAGAVTTPVLLNQPGPYSVVWPTPGNYSVLVQANGFCAGLPKVKPITVKPLPSVSLTPVASQCLEGNQFTFVPIGANGMDSYSWSFGNNALPFNSLQQNPPPVSYSQAGVQQVIFQVSKDGCLSVPDTLNFEVYPMPSASFLINGIGAGIVCPGADITVDYNATPVHPNQVFTWTFQDGTPTGSTLMAPPPISFISGGTKAISLITDYKGCADTLTQFIQVNPLLTADAGQNVEFCEGDGGITVDASVAGGTPGPGYSYVWSSPIPVAQWGISNIHAEDPLMNPTVQPTAPLGYAEVAYKFYAVDAQGCVSNSDTMYVRVKAKPRVDAGPDKAMCDQGPGVMLTGGPAAGNLAPNLSYLWSPSDGMVNPTTQTVYTRPTQTTLYTLTATSSNGCTSVATTLDTVSTVTVNYYPNPIVNAGPDVALCSGETLKLNATAAGAGPSYFYIWTASPGGAVVTPANGVTTGLLQPDFIATKGVDGTTKLLLTVTSNGCVGSDSALVTVHALPETTIGAYPGNAVCYADTITLTATPKADLGLTPADFTYQWFNAGASKIMADTTARTTAVYPIQNTTFKLRVTSPFGCAKDTLFPVTVNPTAVVGILQADTTVCEGTALTLKASVKWIPALTPGGKVLYTWTPTPTIEGNAHLQTIVVRPTTSTTYQVVTETSSFGCQEQARVNITVVPKLEITLPKDTTICSDITKILTAEGGKGDVKYAWYTAPGVPTTLSSTTVKAPVASPQITTKYYLSTEEGVCSALDSITITVNKSPVADFFASDEAMCLGSELILQENNQDAIARAWYFGDNSPVDNLPQHTHVYAAPGVYPVTMIAIGKSNCRDTLVKNITVHAPSVADFTSVPAFANPEALPVDDAVVTFFDGTQRMGHAVNLYAWDFGDGVGTSNDSAPAYTYTQPGTYTVTLTTIDENGCVSRVEHGPYVVEEPTLLVPNVMTPNGDSHNDVFRILFNGHAAVSFSILDRWGRLLFEGNSVNDTWNGQMPDGTPAAAGVYFYKVLAGNKVLSGDLTLIR